MVTPPGIPDEKVMKMKPSFKKRYGDRWKEVLYATLWKHKGSYQEEAELDEHIVKHGSGYRLLSHKGKNLGTFKSKAAAAKHEGEVEWFKKHKNEETQINEISKTLAARYAQSAHDWLKTGLGDDPDRILNRQEGVFRAVSKFKGDRKFAAVPAKRGGRNMKLRYPVAKGHPLNKEESITEERRPIHQIARDISRDWKKPYFGAVPYLDAMHSLESTKEMYGADTGSSVVAYFLGNANTYRGENARKFKQELKDHLKEETEQLDETKVTWGDVLKKHPEYNISTLFKKEQRGFDSGVREINRERKKEGLKRTTADAIRRQFNPRYKDK